MEIKVVLIFLFSIYIFFPSPPKEFSTRILDSISDNPKPPTMTNAGALNTKAYFFYLLNQNYIYTCNLSKSSFSKSKFLHYLIWLSLWPCSEIMVGWPNALTIPKILFKIFFGSNKYILFLIEVLAFRNNFQNRKKSFLKIFVIYVFWKMKLFLLKSLFPFKIAR